MGNQPDKDLRAPPQAFDYGHFCQVVTSPGGKAYPPAVTDEHNQYELHPGIPVVFRGNFQPFSSYKARIQVSRQFDSVTMFIDQDIRHYENSHCLYKLRYEDFIANGYKEDVPFEVTIRIEADGTRKVIGGTFVLVE